MLRSRVVPGLLLLVLALFYAPAARAVDKTTRWYSINVQPATEASPRLFLTSGRKGVTLERYRSGDTAQMWTTTHPDYPYAPRVEGEGPELLECVLQWGCPFEGHGGALVRLVNRASGGCLMVSARGASTAPCDGGVHVPRQKWQLLYSPREMVGAYSPIIASGRDVSCLSATAKAGEAVTGGVVQSQGCGQHWSQNFTLLVSADVTCSTWDYNLCFVEGQN